MACQVIFSMQTDKINFRMLSATDFLSALTFTTLWAFSADDKLMIFFLFFKKKKDLTFHANCVS